MKLLLVCLVLLGCTVSHVSTSEQTQLMKRLLGVLEKERQENIENERRYLYQAYNRKSPHTDPEKPGQMWVDLQMDVNVINECPRCLFYIYYQCVSSECSDKDIIQFPNDGYTWRQFREKFVDPSDHPGVWIDGLESGMEYEVWDGVTEGGDEYDGYTNDERRSVVIP